MIHSLNYILWQVQPEIIDGFRVRWYGLLFALGFLIGIQLFVKLFGKEKNDGTDFSSKDADKLIIYIVLGIVLGARLGHCLFYEWEHYSNNLIEILFIHQGGLASHGGGIGMLVALWLYKRKEKRFSYLWLLDRLAITVALGACFIRFGNLMNSEIIGKSYDGPFAFAFVEESKDILLSQDHITEVKIEKNNTQKVTEEFTYPGVTVSITFTDALTKEDIQYYIERYGKHLFTPPNKKYHRHLLDPESEFTISNHTATVNTFVITRHPSQLYESMSSLLLFFIMISIYLKYRKDTPEGLLSGIFLVWIFVLRFVYEFQKENQVIIEENMNLNIGQKLSIPMILLGIFLVYHSLKKRKQGA